MSFKSDFSADVQAAIDAQQPYSQKLLHRDPGDETDHHRSVGDAVLDKMLGNPEQPGDAQLLRPWEASLDLRALTPPRHLIGLVGNYGSGKDAVGEILAQHGYVRVALADPVRGIAKALGWDGSKEDLDPCPTCGMARGRSVLQKIGSEGVRANLGDQVWIQAADRKVAQLEKAVVTDVRFLNEAAWIRSRGGELWRIVRPGHDGDEHVSETEMRAIVADHVILNVGSLAHLADLANDRLLKLAAR